MNSEPGTAEKRRDFENELLQMGAAVAAFQSSPYTETNPATAAKVGPSEIAAQLRKIDAACTKALQVLVSLDLEHRASQDIESAPYNHAVALQLGHFRALQSMLSVDALNTDNAGSGYPTQVIRDMRALRDAARQAAQVAAPKRGNHSFRSAMSTRAHMVGKNFVFQYRARFEQMPPMSKTGWVVELLQKVLGEAGVDSIDASDVLRRAIEQDEYGRSLFG